MDPALTALSQNQGSSSAGVVDNNAPVGIHCANPDCRTRAGERSRGHQSCRSLLCGHCCQNAARAALELGEQRPVCKVHSRRVHTGHKPLSKENHGLQDPIQPVDVPSTILSPWPTVTSTESVVLQEQPIQKTELEKSLQKSVTLVVWYRNGMEPLRLAHEVSTFPLFRLQDFSELVNELQLQPTAYVDGYNVETGQWEQHKISTVREIKQDQRLLYRLRPSLLDGLTDCPSMDQELALQPQPVPLHLKRQLESDGTPPISNKTARVISNSVPVRPPAPSMSSNPLNTGIPGSPSVTRIGTSWAPIHGSPAPQGVTPAPTTPSAATSGGNWEFAPSGTIPVVNRTINQKPSQLPTDGSSTIGGGVNDDSPNANGNLKRWPTDFTVHEITDGFRIMTQFMTADPRERQRGAFERVFGCRYVKSTVGRAKLYWKRASQEIKDHFLSLPKDDLRGRWQNFVHLMDGRLVIEVGGGGKMTGPAEGVGIGLERDSSKDEQRSNSEEAVNGALTFSPEQMHPGHHMSPHIPVGMGRGPADNLARPPDDPSRSPMNMADPGQMSHSLGNDMMRQSVASMGPNHALNPPAMPLPQHYATDRSMSINRSSSSLSGAMAIPNQ